MTNTHCPYCSLQHLRGRELAGMRIVVQEHGQSLSMVAHALRRRGADVTVVTVYRVVGADDPEPMFNMIDLIADRRLDAVTFTSAPAVAALMDAAGPTGRRDDVVTAFQADVVASCVGPVTAAAFELWGVPTVFPERSRLAAMVKQLETELPSRRDGHSLELADGRILLLHGDDVLLDGIEVHLTSAPASSPGVPVVQHRLPAAPDRQVPGSVPDRRRRGRHQNRRPSAEPERLKSTRIPMHCESVRRRRRRRVADRAPSTTTGQPRCPTGPPRPTAHNDAVSWWVSRGWAE